MSEGAEIVQSTVQEVVHETEEGSEVKCKGENEAARRESEGPRVNSGPRPLLDHLRLLKLCGI